MNILDKIRIRRKIHKMCRMMYKSMKETDMRESASTILYALRVLPQERKEGLIDMCIEVLENEN